MRYLVICLALAGCATEGQQQPSNLTFEQKMQLFNAMRIQTPPVQFYPMQVAPRAPAVMCREISPGTIYCQ